LKAIENVQQDYFIVNTYGKTKPVISQQITTIVSFTGSIKPETNGNKMLVLILKINNLGRRN
jgi:hypothetical protein